MVSVDTAVVAKLKKGGLTFEVLVDCDLAIALKEGKDVNINDVLASEDIFSDSRKGLRASASQLKQIFNTDNHEDAARDIITKGIVQITAEHKAKLIEEKKKRIVNLIHVNGVDPKTKLPHPIKEIESAFEKGNIRIDEFESVERQVQQILKRIQSVLPLKFEVKEISIHIPPTYAAKVVPLVKNWGNMTKNDWLQDGAWDGIIEIPAGMQEEFFDKVSSLTHGNAIFNTLRVKS